MSYINISKWEAIKTWKWALQGGEAAGLWGAGSAGEEREVTGVHDETGVQVQTLWGDKTDQRGETYWLALMSSVRIKRYPKLMFCQPNYAQYFDRDLINTTSRIRRMCVWCKSDALTLVKVELLVRRAVSQAFDVHKVAVDIWIIQCTESHVCKRRGVSPSGLTLIYFLFWIPTCCLLFLDGHGQRRAALHACGHNHLGGRHSNHRRCGGSWCRRCGYGCLLHRFFGRLGGNWDSAILIQLPLYCALNLRSANDDSIRTCLQLNNELLKLTPTSKGLALPSSTIPICQN